MPNRLTLLASAALLALTTPLAAQEAAAPEAPAEAAAPESPEVTTDAEAPAAAAETDAPAATEAPAAPATVGAPVASSEDEAKAGQPYIREEHGDWALRCMRAAEGADPCQMYQLLEDGENNPVAEISVVPLGAEAEAAAGVVVVVPLETQLTEQLTLSIDGGQAVRYPFDFCNRAGCVSRFGLSDEQLSQFKRGRSGKLRIVPAAAPDQQVLLDMSLSGFTAGLDAASASAQ